MVCFKETKEVRLIIEFRLNADENRAELLFAVVFFVVSIRRSAFPLDAMKN